MNIVIIWFQNNALHFTDMSICSLIYFLNLESKVAEDKSSTNWILDID